MLLQEPQRSAVRESMFWGNSYYRYQGTDAWYRADTTVDEGERLLTPYISDDGVFVVVNPPAMQHVYYIIVTFRKMTYKYVVVNEPYVGLSIETKKRRSPNFQSLNKLVEHYGKETGDLITPLAVPLPRGTIATLPRDILILFDLENLRDSSATQPLLASLTEMHYIDHIE